MKKEASFCLWQVGRWRKEVKTTQIPLGAQQTHSNRAGPWYWSLDLGKGRKYHKATSFCIKAPFNDQAGKKNVKINLRGEENHNQNQECYVVIKERNASCSHLSLLRREASERNLRLCLRLDAALSGNHLHFVFSLSASFFFFFFPCCQTPPDFWNALRRNWFILSQHMLFLLHWLMQEGTDCKEKPLCKALYKFSYRFKEFLVWKDKMDTNGWKAPNTKTKIKAQHVATFFLHQKLPVVCWDLLRRRWARWKGKMRDGSEVQQGEKRGWREAEKIRWVSFGVGRPCWRELCSGGGLEEEARNVGQHQDTNLTKQGQGVGHPRPKLERLMASRAEVGDYRRISMYKTKGGA